MSCGFTNSIYAYESCNHKKALKFEHEWEKKKNVGKTPSNFVECYTESAQQFNNEAIGTD